MTDIAWIDVALTAARPKALGALLRYFRNLDIAEEAFQEACLRAIRTWPDKGPPRDPTAWLIFVGRNSGIDALRKQAKTQVLPDEDLISDKEDAESDIADRLDESNYRDDILRLLFICCHPDLPATQQIALALRIVSGLSVQQIARAFLVGESAMEQRITRAKARVAKAGVPFETPGPEDRAERLSIVSTMIYLVFNEGYSQGDPKREAAAFSDEAIRLGRLLLRIFPGEPEIMGLLALMLLQISRRDARFDANGELVLLEDQDRSRWSDALINEALNLLDKAIRHRRPGPYQLQAAIAAIHSRAKRAEDTDWEEIDLLYSVLERLQPSPVVTLNRAVAISKLKGPQEAFQLVETLGEKLDGYFYYHGLRGGLLKQMGRAREAREAFDRAIALANSAAEAAHIRRQIDKLQSEPAHPVAR
ncbi:RNA polymerase sigma factor [Rhizobium mongolense]|uniref:RNA polymerase sigma-70 factor (ECF subfamily) n=2 Tax=Rhizobium mongolense TaxID=57676 RepID=A0ABR6IN19_9HYPH|nr:RNA polymerase sigma factor [Rhizobium mongolense]MBB4229288.1 RNA polymerase sigma-70 factor (ECF subfamily) [Rhizobium mongolense]TVZ63164.1 RNA polymerase sigma-70 factor (ECF subfamily) [Rhizobium mongolense USDA 1844]